MNKINDNSVNKVEAAIDLWKKKKPSAKVTIEVPGNCITIKLCEANIYTDANGNLIFDAE